MPNHGDFLLNTQQLSAMTPADIECAAQLLKQGQLVAIPTETVYGLAADATQPEAV
ncbi:TPA: Sua5/YciO/YrdC/YwlC family protein, partial [Vibrio cholerae]|nr:Sua5/YciO/YrdC/YwlC family protein [Vibrio cholerae]